MARILFIVNEHLDEAFAISVARETAKLLKKAGHVVIWRKFKPEETALGAILKSKKGTKFSKDKLERIHLKLPDAKIQQFINETKPELTYRFHCSPPEEGVWKGQFAGLESRCYAHYEISHEIDTPKNIQLVEIMAYYKRLPRRISRKIKETAPSKPNSLKGYLARTTSQQLTKKAGLHPELFAETIAPKIEEQIENLKNKERIWGARGPIKSRPKDWQRRRRRI